tara:strand:+ start:298 stop:549 length:252 start_codon:yes stop_codon:yes gene_type:complete
MPFVYIIGGGASNMQKANLTSQIDGSTTVFTVPEAYASGSLRVYWNGVRQVVTVTWTETTSTTFTTQFTPQDGDYLTIDYIRG